ncbi:MAG: ATP-binding protein [Candidatus Aminicenantes bacterium]
MRRSIFFKVFGGYFLIIIIFTALLFIVSFHVIKKFYLDTRSQSLENLGRSLIHTVIPLVEENQLQELDSFVKELGRSIHTRITVVDLEGVVLADSDENPALMENHKFRPEIYRALEGHVGESLRFSRTVKEEMLYVGVPLEMDNQIAGVLRVSLYIKDINRLLASLKTDIGLLVLVMTLLALLAAFIFSCHLSRPVREMSEASRRIASGNFNAKVFLKRRDELRELAESFNFMTEQIKNLFQEQSRQKEELNSILSSIQEGLFALDKEGKILFANRSLKKIMNNDQVEDKHYWEVLREPQFVDLIKKVQQEKRNWTQEIALSEKEFLCSATYVDPRGEIVVTLRDITEVKKVERIKKDFILNVSHELRTPLTAIKGYVETLEGEIEEKNRNYLEIIHRHTDRLINMVKDLLMLAELEEREMELEIEKVDTKEVIGNILNIFKQSIKERNLEVELFAEQGVSPVKGDYFKLEQVFINLIDNAVNYTENGKIAISIKKSEDHVSIQIQDTGMGIPEEHLPRIFERFYVVDKSRSKRLGGTGLGLSIVKHIVLLHNGEVKVKSTPGKGTTFTVLLPAF